MSTLICRGLGTQDYSSVWQRMADFTAARTASTADELWLLQHPSVYTQGRAGKAQHLLATGDIPVVQSDRGGQVTYHGPGQLVGYVLFDLSRAGLNVRELVSLIELAIVDELGLLGIDAAPRADAPGVYVSGGAKIAQLGLRVKNGCTFHGLSLNLDMDLSPFGRINPCGMAGLAVTSVAKELNKPFAEWQGLEIGLAGRLAKGLGTDDVQWANDDEF